MKKKGVSPIIATILLIALVVAIGSMIFFWFKGMNQEAITKSGENVELVCNDVAFNVDLNGNKLIIQNYGSVPIYNFDVQIHKSGSYETVKIANEEYFSGWPETGIGTSGRKEITLKEDSKSADELFLIPVLLGVNEDGEEKSSPCEERHGESIEI